MFCNRKKRMQYDFEICDSWRQVVKVIAEINAKGWKLVAVTSDQAGSWTVFFGRLANG